MMASIWHGMSRTQHCRGEACASLGDAFVPEMFIENLNTPKLTKHKYLRGGNGVEIYALEHFNNPQ